MTPDDRVYFNIVKGGSYDTWEYNCGDLLRTSKYTWEDIEKMIQTYPFDETFTEKWGGENRWKERPNLTTDRGKTTIRVRHRVNVMWVSSEPKCYTGEHVKYTMPACVLKYQGKEVPNVITPPGAEYEFAPDAAPTILNQLCDQDMLEGAAPVVDANRVHDADVESKTNAAVIDDEVLKGSRYCPVFYKPPAA